MVYRLLLAIAIVYLTACASLNPSFEKPTVTVKAFRLLPTQTVNPEFVIDLHIVNPNSRALALKGLAYSASIEGYKVLTGVSNQLPQIAPYGDADVSLTASADMLGSFRLLADLMQNQRNGLKYALTLKLDVGNFMPVIYLTEKGELSFNNGGQR